MTARAPNFAGLTPALSLTLTLALALFFGIAPGQAANPAKGLKIGTPGTAVKIVDGDTLVLDDGREVRLVGIQAPKLPLGRRGFPKWPLADAAKAALATLTKDKRLTLLFGGARSDRHGRVLAHLVRLSDNLWIQGELLSRGLARVYSFPDNRRAVAEMLAMERQARAAKRGIWGHPFYAIVSHQRAGRYIGTFQLVEGRVVRTAVIRRWAYINFSADWRTDFTISIRRRDLRRFRKDFGKRLKGLEGKKIRVRGWLRLFNGPMIEATHREQIEVLAP
jgi:endonuclease YncB( thermonuclease family)